MRTRARFPDVAPEAGHYESFYIKAARPGGGLGAWIRHTVHKRPGEDPKAASVWFTLFDAEADGPLATKVTVPESELSVPEGGYIRVDGATFAPGHAEGEIATDALEASWDLSFEDSRRGVPPPPVRLPLRRAAAEDEVPEPLHRTRATAAGSPSATGRSTSTAGRAWSATTGAPSTPSAGSGSRAPASTAATDGWFDMAVGRIKIGPLDHALGRQRDALPRRRAPPPRRLRPDPLDQGLRVADELRLRARRARASRSAAGSLRRARTSSPGSTPTRSAPSTTRSTARSPTSS